MTKNRTTNFSVLIFDHLKNWRKEARDHCSLKMQNPKVKTKKVHIWLLSHWLMQWNKFKASIFRILVVLPKTHFFCYKKLNLNIFVTLFEHSTSMHHQEIASSNMTKDRRQQSRVKRHSIYIRTISSWRLLSALLNWFRLVYGPIGQINMYCTLDFCPG